MRPMVAARLDTLATGLAATRLTAVLDEQQAALVRSAFSTIVRESEDLACGVFATDGQMVAQSRTGTPGHINTMATGVEHFVRLRGDDLRPGDVLLTNDPWLTAGQVNDITVVTPGFEGDRLIGLFASTCHAPDIGGRILSGDASEVFEEGLQLPIIHLAREGELNEDLIRIIRANVRTPDETIGDLHAQAAANDVGIRGLRKLLDDFGLSSVDVLGEALCSRSELAMRAAIEALPDGRYTHEALSDGFDEPVRIAVAVEVAGDELVIDFGGTSAQSRKGINLVLNYTRAYASFAMKAAIAPDVPHNSGSFRPVKVVAAEGSILNCRPPAPVASRHLIGHFLPGVILGALAEALPQGSAMAPGADSIWITVWRGLDDAASPFNLTLFQSGGGGARFGKDGLSATGFPAAVASVPSEVIEALTPLVHRERALVTDSGGAGRWRGGLGQRNRITLRSPRPWSVSVLADRTRYGAPGVGGGGDGAVGAVRRDGAPLAPKRLAQLGPGSEVELVLPGGGGVGDPAERPVEEVVRDVVEGWISIEQAAADYGVVVAFTGAEAARVRMPEDFDIDEEATARRRQTMKGRA